MDARPHPLPLPPAWLGAAAWLLGGSALVALDGTLDLANLALLLVLTAAIAACWLPFGVSTAVSLLAVTAFDWAFVPPRLTFVVDEPQHALMLIAMWATSVLVAALVARQRRLAAAAIEHAAAEARLREFGDLLRDERDPIVHAGALVERLAAVSGAPAALRVPARGGAAAVEVGAIDDDRRAGLELCLHQGHALGPGTGRHEEQPDLYLPLRARRATLGAALIEGYGARPEQRAQRPHLQALCDALGAALQRAAAARDEQAARARAELEQARNTMLTAISHDFRTPLTTIMGAASSLQSQADRLDAARRVKLAATVVDEAARLARLAENTLQLARLDAPGVALHRDWESAEEIVGAVLRRVRARDPSRRVRARLEPALPLLWCDAMLVSQLLENLVDNALKHAGAESPVEILVRRAGDDVLLAVRDRGPGIAPASRQRIFEPFSRGAAAGDGSDTHALAPGSGVGLAVCRAIAHAHGGTMRCRARGHGGSSFELTLPHRAAPQQQDGAELPA